MTTHQHYQLALQAFQSQRLRRDLADLAAGVQYQQIGQFFFEEMYGARDFSVRDEQAQRAHWFVHRVPGVTAHDVETVLDLLELTIRLDDEITDLLIALDAPLDFEEEIYEHAYRLADRYAERVHQINLVLLALGNVHRLGRKKLLGLALQSTRSWPMPSAWATSIASCGWATRRSSRCVTSPAFWTPLSSARRSGSTGSIMPGSR